MELASRSPLVIARLVDGIFSVKTAGALDLVIEHGLVEYAEVAPFVALERNMAEDWACGHVLAVAHGALARGVEVVVVFAVQYDV